MDIGLFLPRHVALVTGASSGIGRATALALGRAGARVAVDASDVSDYVTGPTLCVDGGMSLYPAFSDNG